MHHVLKDPITTIEKGMESAWHHFNHHPLALSYTNKNTTIIVFSYRFGSQSTTPFLGSIETSPLAHIALPLIHPK